MHRLAASFAGAAVASVDYPASVSGFVAHPHRTVATLAQGWAQQLAADLLLRYRRIAFVTHCLGGMVTLQALRLLGERGVLPGHSTVAPRLFCLTMDTPMCWPTVALSAKMAALTQAIGMNATDLATNLAHFSSQQKKVSELVLASIASAVTNPLSVFEPLALARPQASWQVPDRHEDLSRAPPSGPFLPLLIAQNCLTGFFDQGLKVAPQTRHRRNPQRCAIGQCADLLGEFAVVQHNPQLHVFAKLVRKLAYGFGVCRV